MRGFFAKIANFMRGRYGADKLNTFMTVLVCVLWVINIFMFNKVVRYVIDGIMLVLLVLVCVRMFSRNITARSAENRRFLAFYNPAADWFKLQWRKLRDRKSYRYLKCPKCKAQLRVRNRKGSHTVRCPRCGNEFAKKIR